MGKKEEAFAESDNEKVAAEISRVPFSLWVFLLFFLTFRLFSLAQEVNDQREDFKQTIFSACGTVENATNELINLHKTVALDSIEKTADLANGVVEAGLQAVKETVNITVGSLFVIVEAISLPFRCTSATALTLGYNYLEARAPVLEKQTNEEVLVLSASIENSLDEVRNLMATAKTTVQSYINQYNSVVSQLQQHNIDLPPLVVTWPTIPHFNITPVTFPANTSQWQTPDFFALQDDLMNDINPVGYINKELDKIKLLNVTAEQLIEKLGAEAALVKTELGFCAQINFTKFDHEVDKYLSAIHGTIAVVLAVVLAMVIAETVVIVFRHKKKVLRPSWFPEGGKLDKFVQHIWHKPSLTCLLVGLLGIIVLTSLRYGISEAEKSYEREVLAEIQGYVSVQISLINQDLDALSFQFASEVNKDIDQIGTALDQAKEGINSSLSKVLYVQDLVNGYLETYVASVPYAGPSLLSMIQCMASLLTLPVGDIMNLFPNASSLPHVDARVLTFNLTRAQIMINATLDETKYPFTYYDQKLAEDLYYYYYLTIFGLPVMLFGLVGIAWELAQEKNVKR